MNKLARRAQGHCWNIPVIRTDLDNSQKGSKSDLPLHELHEPSFTKSSIPYLMRQLELSSIFRSIPAGGVGSQRLGWDVAMHITGVHCYPGIAPCIVHSHP